MKTLSVLGSTGSIGCQTLDVVAQQLGRFKIVALTAQNNVERLIEQARFFKPECVAIENEDHAPALKEALKDLPVDVLSGESGVCEAASRKADLVMAAIIGAAGLKPIWQAIRQGADIALANKEALVCAGLLLLAEMQKTGGKLLPVDSEHNAIFQALAGQDVKAVSKLILTASGGPFRDLALEQLQNVTLDDALQHPNWQMGRKISVDSATMMNKGLELIEACYLFGKQEHEIDIVIHPQQIVHSMVEFTDGSVLAQMGAPDMRVPIAHCLGWPERMILETRKIDWREAMNLQFLPPDEMRFPALRLARDAARAGAEACIVFNAANEIAVEAFMGGRIKFPAIVRFVEEMLSKSAPIAALSGLDDVLEMDRLTRAQSRELLNRF